MKRLKLMLETSYSIDAIFALRKTPILLSLVFLILLSAMQMTPFAFRMISDYPYRWDRLWGLTEDDVTILEASLPDECGVNNYELTCSDFHEITLSNGVKIQFNGNADDLTNGIVFNKEYFTFVDQGQSYDVGYSNYEGIDFSSATYEDVFSKFATSVKPLFVVPYVLGTYQSGVLTTFVYTFVVAVISMLFKFGHTHFISFKEVLNIIIYSSTFPCVMALVIGMILTPGFNTIIYNFGTPLIAYFVYKRRVIPSLVE